MNAELALRSDFVAKTLLGDPNKTLSSLREYRYGKKGSLSVTVSGRNAGRWYDFEKGEGGGIFQLIQNTKGGSFKDTLSYANDLIGGRASVLGTPRPSSKNSEPTPDQERSQKISRAQKIYQNSKPLDALGKHYLLSRGIMINPGPDVRTSQAKDPETGQIFPTLVGFARDEKGHITGGQNILLNPETDKKAEVTVNKKSFGAIKGSFVTLQQDTNKTGRTFIAEGIETALSIKEVEFEGKIVATLGVHNFKNYTPQKSEKTIVLCADNDGASSKTGNFKILNDTAKFLVEEKGKEVIGVYPPQVGEDFNDVLQKNGPNSIWSIFRKAEVSLYAEPQPAHPTVSTQKTSQEASQTSKEVEVSNSKAESIDIHSREAIRKMSSGEITAQLTQKISAVRFCRNESQRPELEKAVFQFAEAIQEHRPSTLMNYELRYPQQYKTLSTLMEKAAEAQKEQNPQKDVDRGGGFCL
ncbi:MAG: hypothetical protein GY915_06770 [bacterium]|nr:hypothetical protein [bacterium]